MVGTWICVLVKYFVEGCLSQGGDRCYVDSFGILIAISFVFNIFGPVVNAILEYWCNTDSFGHALMKNYMWVPMLIYFSAVWLLSVLILSIDVQWDAITKVKVRSHINPCSREFRNRRLRTLEGITQYYPWFEYTYILVTTGILLMIALAYAVIRPEQIWDFFACLQVGWLWLVIVSCRWLWIHGWCQFSF